MSELSPSDALADLYTTAAKPARVKTTFICWRDGCEAGIVRLHKNWDSGSWVVVVSSFTGECYQRVDERIAEALQDAIGKRDAEWIYAIDVVFGVCLVTEQNRSF